MVLVLLALFEGVISAVTGVRTVSVTDASSYPLGTTSTAECVDYINEKEDNNIDLARTEFTRYHTLNDDAVNGVNGISMFNSMVNMPITNYMERFGICGWIASNRYSYMQSSPFTDMMLNIKYLIDPYYGKYDDTIHYEKVYTANAPKNGGTPAIVMENRYYLPMGFMVNDDLLKYDAANTVSFMNKVAKTDFTDDSVAVTEDPVENQNNFFRLATGIDQDLYIPLDVQPIQNDEGSFTKSSDKKYSFSSENSTGSYYLCATATKSGTALAYVEGYSVEDTNLYINDNYIGHFGTKRPLIMMVGDVKEGDTIKAEAKVANNSSGSITCHIVLLDENLFQSAYQMFSRSTLKADTLSGDELSGTINVAEDGLFYTSIPYVDGWRAYVDGKEVEITPVGSAMLAFKLNKGEHRIELKYMPEGFTAGVAVTIAGLFIFLLMILAVWQKKRLLPIRQRLTAKVAGLIPHPQPQPASAIPDATAFAETDDDPQAEDDLLPADPADDGIPAADPEKDAPLSVDPDDDPDGIDPPEEDSVT